MRNKLVFTQEQRNEHRKVAAENKVIKVEWANNNLKIFTTISLPLHTLRTTQQQRKQAYLGLVLQSLGNQSLATHCNLAVSFLFS